MKKTLIQTMKRNIMLYYIYRALATMNFIVPVLILFLSDKGFSAFQIFTAQAIYTATELILTVPCGVMSDKIGRKKTLIISSIATFAAYMLYGFSNTFTDIIIAEIILGIASATFVGAGDAFVYDTLASASQQKKYKHIIGNSYAIHAFVLGATSVAGGILAKQSLALPFFATAIPAVISLIPIFFVTEPKIFKTEEIASTKILKEAIIFVAKHARLRSVMLFSGFVSLSIFVSWILYQPILSKTGIGIEYIGIIIMLLSVAHGLGNKLAQKFEDKLGHLDIPMIFSGICALLYLLIYLSTGYLIIAIALLAEVVGGIITPQISEWVNMHTKSENRATVLALSQMTGLLAISLFSPFFGIYIDAFSEKHVFMLLAVLMGGYALIRLVGSFAVVKAPVDAKETV